MVINLQSRKMIILNFFWYAKYNGGRLSSISTVHSLIYLIAEFFVVFFFFIYWNAFMYIKNYKRGLVIDTLTQEITLSKESKIKQKKCTASWWNQLFLFPTVISIKNQRTLIFFFVNLLIWHKYMIVKIHTERQRVTLDTRFR